MGVRLPFPLDPSLTDVYMYVYALYAFSGSVPRSTPAPSTSLLEKMNELSTLLTRHVNLRVDDVQESIDRRFDYQGRSLGGGL